MGLRSSSPRPVKQEKTVRQHSVGLTRIKKKGEAGYNLVAIAFQLHPGGVDSIHSDLGHLQPADEFVDANRIWCRGDFACHTRGRAAAVDFKVAVVEFENGRAWPMTALNAVEETEEEMAAECLSKPSDEGSMCE